MIIALLRVLIAFYFGMVVALYLEDKLPIIQQPPDSGGWRRLLAPFYLVRAYLATRFMDGR